MSSGNTNGGDVANRAAGTEQKQETATASPAGSPVPSSTEPNTDPPMGTHEEPCGDKECFTNLHDYWEEKKLVLRLRQAGDKRGSLSVSADETDEDEGTPRSR